MPQTRQLAAIVFTDIVGYTALMQENEHGAMEKISRFRYVIETYVPKHNGKIIQYYGDGCLLLFNSTADAVQLAEVLQEHFRNDPVVPVRIGIHLGDVLLKEDNVFGDGVNVSSRIKSLGQANSVLFSSDVQDKIKNNPDFKSVSLGFFDFKNVHKPLEVFALANKGLALPEKKKMTGKLKSKPNKKKKLLLILSLLLISVAAFFISQKFLKKSPAGAEKKSIAVLPFINRSSDKNQEYFSDGLSEELLNLLAKIADLKVIGRTSSFYFKGKTEDIKTIGEKLDVAYILEGSVQKEGPRIRVTAQLIRVSDGIQLWSKQYDREMESVFKLQDEIAQAVVQELKLKLLKGPGTVSVNIEAYNLILQGNYFYDKLDKDNVAKAVDFYNQALAIDSTDARAWGQLAHAISRQAWQNYIDQNTGYEKARQAALKAISLDSNEAIGQKELAAVKLYHDFDWRGAEKTYETALSLEPENPDILYGIGGGLYFATGRWEEAIRDMKKCIELDPLKPLNHLNLGNILTYAHRIDEANTYFKKALELNPQFQRAHMYLGRNYLLSGKSALALKEMQQENLEVFRIFGLALTYHALGRSQEANDALQDFTDRFQNDWNYLLAELHAFRGEKDKAFMWLEAAYSKKDSWLIFLKGDPLLKNLEGDPRHAAFLKKMNLPVN